MAPLSTFLLPLPSNGPPTGYSWEGHDMSVLSTTTAFNTGIDERDIFLGKRRCVVCGESADAMLQYCYVIKDKELETVQKFVLVNHSNHPILAEFHGKAIALDIKDHHAPFPSLFILHEMRVHGIHPFQTINPEVSDGGWQDWIYSEGVFDDLSNSFKQNNPDRKDIWFTFPAIMMVVMRPIILVIDLFFQPEFNSITTPVITNMIFNNVM
ncbi:hypothetical protein CVT25_004760 [Psilocybe cyanescens]|uniref:Uncharacterized protein n=1 Tax=Psilocybe cyanescens TaxID=93625 RepID=A0A409XGI1_PSICY|nr:hypothetical protein CVT25_004760 [Psilocybe cyanescens]